MAPDFARALRRYACPRSRHCQLWACAYCAAFDGEAATDSTETGPNSTATDLRHADDLSYR